MKVLLINKFYYEHGGAERYFFALKDLLEGAGHEVITFAMAHPSNEPSPYAKYFVSHVDLSKPAFSWQGLRAAGRIIYSFEAARKLKELIATERPDVAHLHNIYHQLSPSILKVLKEKKVPTVQTIHDYGYLSPSYGLFDHNVVCERVKPHRYFAAVRHRCVKNSVAASLLDAMAMSYHYRAGLDERLVGRLISPSVFVRNKFAEWGRDISRMRVVPHFIHADAYEPDYAPGSDIVYVGRLSDEKGIGVLVAAMGRLPGERLRIYGTGPMEARLKKYCADMKVPNVQFMGKVTPSDALMAVASARFVVVPSLFYEPFGLAALESLAMGKAVIASTIGALPELITDRVNGLLVPPGDVDALADAIKMLSGNEELISEFGRAGRARAEERYRPDDHLKSITAIYEEVI
jgi:glycosyltransferase involved in cell wall biosynthesis